MRIYALKSLKSSKAATSALNKSENNYPRI
jgi:hypothetical protein